MLICVFLVGFILGIFSATTVCNVKCVGKLVIDSSQSKISPFLFLELSKEVHSVKKSKYIVLKTVETNSQK